MILLCSNGLTSEKIKAELRKHVKGCKSAAVVVTADNEYKENNYHVPERVEELESLGLEVGLFDIDVADPELLSEYDVVLFIGGNPFYLLDSIRSHGAERVLRLIAREKVLIGVSAAAFVFSPSLELCNQYTPEMNFVGLVDLTGLALTEVEVLPHYSRYLEKFPGFEDTCAKYEKKAGKEVVRLNDGDGVFVCSGCKDGEKVVQIKG